MALDEVPTMLDFRRSLVSGLPSPRRVLGRSAGSFPEQRLVIEPKCQHHWIQSICYDLQKR